MEKDKYAQQKKYLATKKQLKVWVDPEKYELFKKKAKENGTSVHALVTDLMNDYIRESTAH